MEPPDHQDNLLYEHPLTNHVILEQVFNFLGHSGSIQDWKNVRLVCKLWHDETLVRWRSTAVLSFVRDQTIFEPPLPRKTTPLAFFTELQNPESPYKLREVPYQRYKFKEIQIYLPHGERNKVGALFWNLVGPSIKHLTLEKVRFLYRNMDPGIIVNIVSFLVEATPNLETLTLYHVRDDAPLIEITIVHPKLTSLHWVSPDDCDFELDSFPNLQEVFLKKCKDMDFFGMIGCYRGDMQSDLGHSSVKRLNLMESKMGNDFLFRSSDQKLRFPSLEHFSIHLLTENASRYSEHDALFLPVFVRNHRETLKCLEVFTSIYKLPPEVCPLSTELKALTQVRLWGTVVKNLGFLRFTPNLKLLHVDLYGVEKGEKMIKALKNSNFAWNEIQNAMQVNAGILKSTVDSEDLIGVVLNKLEYFQVNCSLSPEDVQNLSDWMPNLKILKAVLNAETISGVCEKWPALEHLVCLFGSVLGDESITGNCKDNELKSLIDLKRLKSFEYNANCDSSTLTDECVVNGFLETGELTRLQICVSRKFTEKAEQLLSEQIQNVKVLRNYDDHSKWECCKNAQFRQFLDDFDPGKYVEGSSSSDSSTSSSYDGSMSENGDQ